MSKTAPAKAAEHGMFLIFVTARKGDEYSAAL